MELYIQIENGQPVNHPALGDNIREALGEVPSNWEPFNRLPRPEAGVYQIVENTYPVYIKVDGVWTDDWGLRDMTPQEVLSLKAKVKLAWEVDPFAWNFSAWTFDDATCKYVPPVPSPGSGYLWCGAENSWKTAPVLPQDNQSYTFDYTTWSWTPA
jgi:hypothetical protein